MNRITLSKNRISFDIIQKYFDSVENFHSFNFERKILIDFEAPKNETGENNNIILSPAGSKKLFTWAQEN